MKGLGTTTPRTPEGGATPGASTSARKRRIRRVVRAAAGFAAFTAVTISALMLCSRTVTAEERTGPATDERAAPTEQELRVLRQLLGLPGEQKAPAPAPPPAAAPAPPPPAPSVEAAPPAPQAPPAAEEPAPGTKGRGAKPLKKAPVVRRTPRQQAPSQAPAGEAPGEEPAEATQPAPAAPAAPAKAAPAAAAAAVAIPPAGTVISSSNVEQWKHLLGPSIQWSIARGATVRVADAQPAPLEQYRITSTQKYSAQVTLAPDKRSMRNYVAGIPFPIVDENDPDAGTKLMYDMESRIIVDDLDIRNFACDTGKLSPHAGMEVERHYENEHFRRLFYVGREIVDPKPTWPTADGVHHREMLYPLLEPFDLKGAGFTYIRYLDPSRQDDSWLYFPQQKRVRRLGTAQRSEGVFGQDVDLDSYGGFSGNPSWTDWKLLGKKTILASIHGQKEPLEPKFEPGSANFFPDDVWEPREVWVILGVSRLGGYNFGRRIIYLDREAMLIPYTEIYDLKGGLWRTLVHTWKLADRPNAKAKKAVYDGPRPFILAFSLIDMQLEHATKCQFPSPNAPGEDGWYYNFGTSEGTTEDVFSVSNFIDTGR